jgi:DNA invertase Pin-like site-specific DNA recombinase
LLTVLVGSTGVTNRLARSTRDLLNILHDLGNRGVGFGSLADAWADTTTAG